MVELIQIPIPVIIIRAIQIVAVGLQITIGAIPIMAQTTTIAEIPVIIRVATQIAEAIQADVHQVAERSEEEDRQADSVAAVDVVPEADDN